MVAHRFRGDYHVTIVAKGLFVTKAVSKLQLLRKVCIIMELFLHL